MTDDAEYLRLLRRKAEQVAAKSPGIQPRPQLEAATADPAMAAGAHTESGALEAVIRWYRPVLVVTDDRFVVSQSNPGGDPRFADPNETASKAMMEALELRRGMLDPVIRSVGRIELNNNVNFPWVGTGWILGSDLGSDVIVTNAHVGREFGMRSGEGYVFRPGVPDLSVRQSARIDFREEVGLASPREFPITDIIWISETPGLDVCLLRVARSAGADRIDPPVRMLTDALAVNRMLAVIGFPGSSNGYDPALFQKLFGSVTGNKRFSPGFYSGRRAASETYDCSTLPGSSGSVVVDVETGRAVGLHYAGTAFDTNFAVPAADLARIVQTRPWQGESAARPQKTLGDASSSTGALAGDPSAVTPPRTSLAADGTVTFVLPLEITVRLGAIAPQGAPPIATSVPPPAARSDRAAAEAAAERVRLHLLGDKSVLSVKADYLFRDGAVTDDFGVIVGVAPGAPIDPAAHGLGGRLDGVAISVETADPATIAEQMAAFNTEAFAGRTAGYRRDQNDPRFDLSPVTDDMTITLHVSPEGGWPVLEKFLAEAAGDRLTIGMYHMTAPHVVEAIAAIARKDDARITLTLDRQRGDAAQPDDTGGDTKADDIPERDTLETLEGIAGKRFKWAPASLGGNGLFPSAYHIKVAVWSKAGRGRAIDDRAFWLSSGNWQSSNQAPVERRIEDIGKVTQAEVEGYNREWHAVVAHKGLAATFRHHLEQDFEDNAAAAAREAPTPSMFDVLVPVGMIEEAPRARAFRSFPPETLQGKVKVQPLLTPDNYPEVIAELISAAERRVWIENQSFSLWKEVSSTPAHFLKIAEAVRERQKRGVDVKIIFRSGFGKERETLRQLKRFGLAVDADHVRYFDKCHTKGIVIDSDIAVLGSQNWTAAGTGPNRDASLVIWHKTANAYFARVFEYDWSQLARGGARIAEAAAPLRVVSAGDEAPVPAGYRRVSLAEFLGET